MKKRIAVTAAALAAVASGCAAAPQGTTEATTEAGYLTHCYPAPQALQDRLELPAMQRHGGQLKVLQAAATPGATAWLVAARIDLGDGGDPLVGVWATQGMETENPIYAMDAAALAVTAYPSAAAYGMDPAEALQGRSCIE